MTWRNIKLITIFYKSHLVPITKHNKAEFTVVYNWGAKLGQSSPATQPEKDLIAIQAIRK